MGRLDWEEARVEATDIIQVNSAWQLDSGSRVHSGSRYFLGANQLDGQWIICEA